jgi:hypothetical protein
MLAASAAALPFLEAFGVLVEDLGDVCFAIRLLPLFVFGGMQTAGGFDGSRTLSYRTQWETQVLAFGWIIPNDGLVCAIAYRELTFS